MTASPLNDTDLQAALDGVEQAIRQVEGCDEAERRALTEELRELRDLAEKLRNERIEIVFFGEISTGKSALINALAGATLSAVDARGGWTKEVWRHGWESQSVAIAGLEGSSLVLVDTPGLNEVRGDQRADLARQAAERADVVVFVTDSDLNESEHNALAEIAGYHKPLLLVVNKADLYSPEEVEALRRSLSTQRVARLLGGAENLVFASAEPREVEHFVTTTEGSTRQEWRRPPAAINGVRERLIELLADEGKALVALNAAMYAADRSDRVAALRVRMRTKKADRVVWGYAVTKSLAVAMNPWAVADVAGGLAVDAAMVATLGRVYGFPITMTGARELVIAILKAAGWLMLGEAVVSFGSSFFKGLTFGGSTVLTALPQGAAAGYGSYLVGQAARYYFEHGASWGEAGPKRVVTQILDNTDKGAIVERLKGEIRQKMSRNRHAGR
ncbi:YcjF family protein [Botrimarina hoheduenensis]|uniref:GTPase Era n=1 Tax=Botrimarina hoheduenensis TaxID=2528000 RepID=A0A5C5W6Y5_9BACT|nr:GTP-binding protein [Botrimarina hoheduenensis]TWT46450.1 GTPase Era [Botrimarina hoheduenensis]